MILRVDNLTFSYHSKLVLDKVSFSIDRGECVAILGINGAGKSTLLKCINRILTPEGGCVFIDSIDITKMHQIDIAKNIGYVPQRTNTTRMTVFDAVLLGRRPYIKIDATNEDIDIVNDILKNLSLEDYSLKYIDELSGGEFQKVLIARALAQQPKVLLLDEPTSSLDLKNQIEVLDFIKDIAKKNGISVVVVIHDLNLALRFADKYILMRDSRIYSVGGEEVITEESIRDVYSVDVKIENISNKKIIIPI
ncbi:ABC transporter ATP-binding protein [Caloramator proteoclasticus]|uniref:Iron complex transport system ATP-binding protein n=1 Tax=Caloramator proteoclasticus DSM 10124 TaxID=1121262 RepID=A0A1M4XTV3_9CLOT|nr:ABC transporter ATP-binding protein [Caloramator proteoclasticus]SHE97007.1 iron complex transport system ATP-binding protein [Caloramator proteoclasticus DSM 10124]